MSARTPYKVPENCESFRVGPNGLAGSDEIVGTVTIVNGIALGTLHRGSQPIPQLEMVHGFLSGEDRLSELTFVVGETLRCLEHIMANNAEQGVPTANQIDLAIWFLGFANENRLKFENLAVFHGHVGESIPKFETSGVNVRVSSVSNAINYLRRATAIAIVLDTALPVSWELEVENGTAIRGFWDRYRVYIRAATDQLKKYMRATNRAQRIVPPGLRPHPRPHGDTGAFLAPFQDGV